MNLQDEIKRLRKLISTRCPLAASEATMLCDELEKAHEVLRYYSTCLYCDGTPQCVEDCASPNSPSLSVARKALGE